MNDIISMLGPRPKRILIVTGHYGSGKTEFSVSLAMLLAEHDNRPYPRLALVDLDIVNPYFRSRERTSLLENAGIRVYGGVYKTEITAEIPELAADIRAPLEDKGGFVSVAAGGNASGAKVRTQFKKYFTPGNDVLACLNLTARDARYRRRRRPYPRHREGVQGFGGGDRNNTHLARTTADTILSGHRKSEEFCAKKGKRLWVRLLSPGSLLEPKSWLNSRGF
jgi:energy-coupling factor transporter ATP-binding protein EcfA2